MLDPEREFIIDAVAHPYNHLSANYADPASAEVISELSYQIGGVGSPDPRYDMRHDVYLSDWSPEDVANVIFRETATDIATVHTLPLFVTTMVSAHRRSPRRLLRGGPNASVPTLPSIP